jgi:hypothetical protein
MSSDIKISDINNKWSYTEVGLKNDSNIEVEELVVRNDSSNNTPTSITILKNVRAESHPDAELRINFGFVSDQNLEQSYEPLIIAKSDGEYSYNSANMKLILQCNHSRSGAYQSKISLNQGNINFGYQRIGWGIDIEQQCYINAVEGKFYGNVSNTNMLTNVKNVAIVYTGINVTAYVNDANSSPTVFHVNTVTWDVNCIVHVYFNGASSGNNKLLVFATYNGSVTILQSWITSFYHVGIDNSNSRHTLYLYRLPAGTISYTIEYF